MPEEQKTMTCTGVSMATVQQVFAEMQNTFDIWTFNIEWSVDLGMIPANFLYGQEILDQLEIKCVNPDQILDTADDAFVSTKSSTPKVVIVGCNLQLANLKFIQEFDQLTALTIKASSNFFNLPVALPKLSHLAIDNCSTFEYSETVTARPGTLRLVNLTLSNSHLTDETMNLLLIYSLSNSFATLQNLNFSGNELSRVPFPYVNDCQKLSTLFIDQNKITNILNDGSLSFKVPVSIVHLDFNEISIIESGSFSGKLLIGNLF